MTIYFLPGNPFHQARAHPHEVTASKLGKTLTQIGLLDDVSKLQSQLANSNNKKLRTVSRRMDVALRPMQKGISDARRPYILAQSAIAAHLSGDDQQADSALRRCRTLMEKEKLDPERPFDADPAWLTNNAGTSYGGYFVLALASCGKGEAAEKILESTGLKSSDWLFYPFTTLNLCHRLVLDGDTDRAVRIVRKANDGRIPAELQRTLCLHALRNRDNDTAEKFASEYIQNISRLSFVAYPRWGKNVSISEQGNLIP